MSRQRSWLCPRSGRVNDESRFAIATEIVKSSDPGYFPDAQLDAHEEGARSTICTPEHWLAGGLFKFISHFEARHSNSQIEGDSARRVKPARC